MMNSLFDVRDADNGQGQADELPSRGIGSLKGLFRQLNHLIAAIDISDRPPRRPSLEAGKVHPRFHDQGRQADNEIGGSKMTCVVLSRYGVFSWVAPAHPCARDTCKSIHVVPDVAVRCERQGLLRDGWPTDSRQCPVRP